MSEGFPVRRPLVPVALAGLGGTLFGLLLAPAPLIWTGLCLVAGAAGWWGPKKIRSPAIWIFVAGVFAIYAGARAFAPAVDSLKARAGEEADFQAPQEFQGFQDFQEFQVIAVTRAHRASRVRHRRQSMSQPRRRLQPTRRS